MRQRSQAHCPREATLARSPIWGLIGPLGSGRAAEMARRVGARQVTSGLLINGRTQRARPRRKNVRYLATPLAKASKKLRLKKWNASKTRKPAFPRWAALCERERSRRRSDRAQSMTLGR